MASSAHSPLPRYLSKARAPAARESLAQQPLTREEQRLVERILRHSALMRRR